MRKSTISTFKLFEVFPDQEAARLYLEGRLWPNGAVCPDCRSGERITVRGRLGFYHCNTCNFDFTVRTGTILERSHIPLHKWVYAMYLLVTARKRISSMQLAKEIGVTLKTAWFMLSRLREACSTPDSIDKLKGVIEIHEAFFGGKEKNKHQSKRLRPGGGTGGKTAMLGMHERGGRTRDKVIELRTIGNVPGEIHANVEVSSQLYTDDHIVFDGLYGLFFRHEAITHAAGKYARGPATTNSIESVWAVLKRGIYGVYHQVSAKRLDRYVQEFAFPLNQGNVANHTFQRLNSFVDAIVGKRLTYARLIAKVPA